MAIKVSTGLRNYMLDTGSLKAALAGGFIKIYSGAVPATADAAPTGTLLVTISESGTATGINMAASAASGTIVKAAGETWSGTVLAPGGVATYYRHVGASDTGASSTSEPRIQGDIAAAGAALNLSSTTLVESGTQTIDYYSIALPTL